VLRGKSSGYQICDTINIRRGLARIAHDQAEHLTTLAVLAQNGLERRRITRHFSPPRRLYSDADTSRLDVLDYLGNPFGFIDFTTELKYLGSIVHHSLTSDSKVDKRVN
jgi:hypothetical protein